MKTKFIVCWLAVLLVVMVYASPVWGQGATAFTYQGQLLCNGTNVNGTNSLVFTLYSAASGGTVISTPVTNSLGVSNGLFSVNLNFGAGAFNGSARWLDIAVSNGVSNVDLSPRTQVLPTPYAMYANAADTAGAATNIMEGGGGLTNVTANLRMQVFDNIGDFTFTVPTNVNSVIVEVWGGGGGGGAGNASDDSSGGGGGGGGYAKAVLTVTPGLGYPVVVGSGGSAGDGGEISSFDNPVITASGGSAGLTGGASGITSGGSGRPGNGTGSAGTLLTIKGGTGQYGTVSSGGNGGAAGAGGAGGLGGNEADAAGTGNSPGGGGGGGFYTGVTAGAAGANGEVIVYY